MKKLLFTLLAVLAVNVVLAQEEDGTLKKSSKSFMNLYFGGIYSNMKMSHKVTDQGYEFEFNSPGGFGALEYALDGVRFMTEFGYQKAGNDWDVEFVDKKNGFKYDTENQFETPSFITGMFYVGFTPFGTKSWFQLPLYFGMGADYVTGVPNKKANVSFGAKIRANMYFTNNVGLFIGGHYKFGIASRDYDMGGNIGNAELEFKNNTFGVEGGLTVLIGRKK